MLFKTLSRQKVALGLVLVVGFALGIVGYGFAGYFSGQSQAPSPVYQKNESGQTYGSDAGITSLEQEPDLIQAESEDGTVGYVLSKDLNGDMPKSPKEAIAMQSKTKSARIIPLYASDGKTVVGSFKIETGDFKELTKPVH